MVNEDLHRIREDLATMRQAVGCGPPFGKEHVWGLAGLAVVGAAVAAVTAGTNISARPAEPGSPTHLAYIALIVVPVAVVLAVMGLISRRRKDRTPAAWRESRASWIAALVGVPLYIGFAVWATRHGVSAGGLAASTFFLAGLFVLTQAIADRSRRFLLSWAIATMLGGLLAPLGSYESAGILAGAWLIVGGVSTAAVMARQLHKWNRNDAH